MSASPPWHEDPGFWKDFAPVAMFGNGSYRRGAEEAGLLNRWLPPGARVLDLACGPGRHAVELARLGHRVVGLDRTLGFLHELLRRAATAGVEVGCVAGDMRRFGATAAFDAVVSLSTSFGLFEDASEDLRVLENARRALRPEGCLILDLVGKEILARRFQGSERFQQPGLLVTVERSVESGWSWIEERWTLVDDEGRRDFRMAYRPYSGTELCRALRDSGFGSLRVLGDLAGAPYDDRARRLVVIASRGDAGEPGS